MGCAMARTFNSLAYSKKLKEAGFTDRQAETLADAQVQVFDDSMGDVATKQDLASIKQDMLVMKAELRNEIAETKISLIKWTAGLLAGQTALVITLMKFLLAK